MDIFDAIPESDSNRIELCGVSYTPLELGMGVATGFIGCAMVVLLVCYFEPRYPPPWNELYITAREYEALDHQFYHKRFWLDLAMVISLGVMTISACVLSVIHVYCFATGYLVYAYSGESSNPQSTRRSERVGLVPRGSVSYGGLVE